MPVVKYDENENKLVVEVTNLTVRVEMTDRMKHTLAGIVDRQGWEEYVYSEQSEVDDFYSAGDD